MRPRAAAGLLLLVVTAHAFVAGSTHFHRRAVADVQTTHAILHGGEGGDHDTPLSADEAQCLLCRLQRSFVSDLQNGSLSVAPPHADARGFYSPRPVCARDVRSLLPSGRAPPSA